MYLDYNGLKKRIELFKDNRKRGEYTKLPGYYMFTKTRFLVLLNVFPEQIRDKDGKLRDTELELDFSIKKKSNIEIA